ncbi:MAG TPA: EAL domain-containing protein [Gammaproteobacteria bacterium]|nr:EAL domain-containing protein [Gammaproteobacteria bacterium]
MRLQNKILALLVPLIVLPILALGWTAYALLIDDARQRTRHQVTTLLEQIRLHKDAHLQTARANASLFASTGLVKKYVSTYSASKRALLKQDVLDLLFNYQLAYPEYFEIRIISRDGKELLRSVIGDVENRTDDESSSQWFQEARQSGNAIHTAFLVNPDNGEPVLIASKPLTSDAEDDENGPNMQKLHGYLVLTIDLGFLDSLSHNMSAGKSGDLFFTDANGTILFHPDKTRKGQQIDHALFARITNISDRKTLLDAPYRDAPGHYQAIRLDDWLHAVAAYEQSEFSDKRSNLGQSVTMIAGVAILLTIAFLFAVLKSLLIRPIQKLGSAAREMGRGQLLVPINVDTRDEIGDLANTFREMGENLNHYHEQVHYVAYHDSLTGLPNRLMFKDYLKRATAEARRNNQELSILFLDLDNFKRINDTLGHIAGDNLLEAFAVRLQACLRETDVISHSPLNDSESVMARLAGDEFIIMLPRTTGPANAQKVSRRVLELMSEPFVINKQELYISSSIGIALFPDDGDNVDDLMKNADIAMYHAKKSGRNNYQYFSKRLNEESLFKLKIESKLRHAVENNELEMYYQPQVALATGEIAGAECLLRWKDEELGMVSPDVFIPIAEEYGLIIPFTEWLINDICTRAQAWSKEYAAHTTMAINISAIHFCGHDLEGLIYNTLQQTGFDPKRLVIELTETSVLQDPGLAIRTLGRIQSMGLQTSLDDFGTGYSSLNYLMQLPLDKLKIDRSFIVNMDKGEKGIAIVSAIIAMAHSLGLEVIAEGVEDESHIPLLRKMRCDIAQGYYIAHPMPAAEFELLLSGNSRQLA